MTVTLADFAYAVRPTVSSNEITTGAAPTGSTSWSAGVASSGGYLAHATPAAVTALTDQYTIVVVADPNQTATGYRALVSVPAYSGASHVPPYHCVALGAFDGTSRLYHHRTIANTGSTQTSGTGAINTATDSERCYAVRRNGTTLEFVVDGTVHTTTTTGTGPIDWSPVGDITIASRSRTDPGEGCAGTYRFVGIATRWLTDAELAEIAADPLAFEVDTTLSAPVAPPAQWPSVDLLNSAGHRIGEAVSYDLDAAINSASPGEWVMTAPLAALALDATATLADIVAVRVVDELGVAYTGTVRPLPGEDVGGVIVEGVGTSAVVTFTGSDAGWAALASRRAYPDPTTEAPWVTSHDTRTGRASTVAAEFIEANLGSTALPDREWPDLDVVDGVVGTVSTWSARLQRLDRLVARICNDSGLVCRPVFALDGTLRITLTARADLSARRVLSDQADLSDLMDRSFTTGASLVIAAGQGELAARTFVVATTTASGRDRAEHFIDRRNLADPSELASAAVTELSRFAASRVIRAELAAPAAEQMRYRFHYDVGDIVSVEIGGVRYRSAIESVRIRLTASEYTITPQFGDAAPDAWSALVRAVDAVNATADENTT